MVTEIKNAHGVQITTRRFGGHEKLFAYREVGRRAIVALSGIQAPTRAYGKTNGEGNTMEEDRGLEGWKEIQSYIGLDKDTIIEQGYLVRQLDEGCSVCYASSKLFQG